MGLDPHMEDKVLKPERKKSYIGLVILCAVIVAAGTFALYIRNAGISADTLTPPTPAEPTDVTPPEPNDPNTTAVPPTPGDPASPGQFTFPAGWSMVSASSFASYSLAKLESSGVLLYSFNDPNYPTTSWTIFPGNVEPNTSCTPTANTACPQLVAGQKISLYPRTPLGYYAYNPTGKAVAVTLDKASVAASKVDTSVFGRGYHLLYWAGNALTKDQLLSKIKITYADKSQLSGTQAVAADKHTASLKIYVVVNQNNINFAKSVKELTGTDSATTISKLPKNSYYWIYLRRTSQRASSMGYGRITATPSATATGSTEVIIPPVPTMPTQTSTN